MKLTDGEALVKAFNSQSDSMAAEATALELLGLRRRVVKVELGFRLRGGGIDGS